VQHILGYYLLNILRMNKGADLNSTLMSVIQIWIISTPEHSCLGRNCW